MIHKGHNFFNVVSLGFQKNRKVKINVELSSLQNILPWDCTELLLKEKSKTSSSSNVIS